jgi:aminoglycoside phosphotransferase (APT) family kinase protein
LERLARWLGERSSGSPPPALTALGKPGSGYSAENLVLRADWNEGLSQKVVLRRDTVDPPIYPAQSPGSSTGVVMQHSIMDALRRSGRVPVAQSLGIELDPKVLGVPFFVMVHVPGDVPGEDPPYTRAGFFVEASGAERSQLLAEGLGVLARIHEIDVDDPALDTLRPAGVSNGARRQLQVWEDCLRGGLAGRSSPLLEKSLQWLHEQLPPPSPLVLSWGDSRPGNMIWQDFKVACVTDFEGAAIGPRELDVGWWLMFDRWMHEISGVERLSGEPDRGGQLADYERIAGVSLGDTAWYEVFSALRFATTVVLVMNRWVARGAMPEDQVIWRDNPATAVLADLMKEVAP